MARIRNIMKLDPDLQIASNEAVFAVTKAVELFIESLAREAYTYTAQAKKKTIQKRDVDLAISAVDSLMFLDGALNFWRTPNKDSPLWYTYFKLCITLRCLFSLNI